MDKSFDLQHLEMTGLEEELRTTDTEEDSGIYDPLSPEGTTDAMRAKNVGKHKDTEEDSGIYDPLSPEGTTDAVRAKNVGKRKDTEDDSRIYVPLSPEGTTDAMKAKNVGKRKVYVLLKRAWITISSILNVVFIIAIIVLAVKLYEKKPCPICAPLVHFACPESWIVYEGKYFYVSEEKRNWSTSSDICSSFNTSLAEIATQKELDFFANYLRSDHWFRLSTKDSQIWKWPNGTEFTNQFPVEGEGFCPYVNGNGANGAICSEEKRFLCNYPESCHKA